MRNDKNKKPNTHQGGGVSFGGNVIMGNGNQIAGRDVVQSNVNNDDENKVYADVYATIERHARLTEAEKYDLTAEIEELRKELGKRSRADESFLMRRIRNIARIAPDILDVTLAAIINPALGLGVFAKKLAEKARRG